MKILFTIAILSIGFAARAQTLFMAYKITGKVYHAQAGKKIPVKMGNFFNENDTVMVDPKSSVIFICNNFSVFHFNKQNTYSLKPIAANCKVPANSFDAVYFKYIWQQLSHPHESPEHNHKKFMSNVGGSVRGCPGIELDGYLDTIKYVSGDFFIRWHLLQPAETTTINFYTDEAAEKPLLTVNTTSDSVNIRGLSSKDIPTTFYWSVDKMDCPKKYIEIWTKADLDSLISSIPKNNNSDAGDQDYYRIGFFLETEHFYHEALKYYISASEADPSNVLYKETVPAVKKMYHL